MKTKNFFLTAAVVLATALTGAMMTSCSKIDIPVADNDGYPPLPKGKTVKLDTLSTEYVAVNGDTLTGTLAYAYLISITNGATVTLSGVTIHKGEIGTCLCAGITCLGNATIVLADETINEVGGLANNQPGIQAGPEGTTLTICSGENGTGGLTATGGDYAAGIGSGPYGSCGDITIEGGKITATGGDYAAGIGSGQYGSCGNITIRYPASGTAMGGLGSPYDIGAGDDGVCGEVSVEAETIKGSWDGSSPEDAPIGGGTGDSPIGGEGTIIVHAGVK